MVLTGQGQHSPHVKAGGDEEPTVPRGEKFPPKSVCGTVGREDVEGLLSPYGGWGDVSLCPPEA